MPCIIWEGCISIIPSTKHCVLLVKQDILLALEVFGLRLLLCKLGLELAGDLENRSVTSDVTPCFRSVFGRFLRLGASY